MELKQLILQNVILPNKLKDEIPIDLFMSWDLCTYKLRIVLKKGLNLIQRFLF